MSARPRLVLLDRDGTLNVKPPEGEYVTHPAQLRLLPGAAAAVRRLNEAGIPVAVVTNQRGVALGRMTAGAVDEVNAALRRTLAAEGAHVDGVWVCPHDRDTCDCRKPEPGLLVAAARELGVPVGEAVMIGDADSDVEAGRRAGTRTVQVTPAVSLAEAVDLLLRPLVSVGIPTYQRASSLERAVRSVLEQDVEDLEVVVSDDGSDDGTEALCRAWAAREPRLRYVRQPENRGHARNFQAVRDLAHGRHFLWLADDDRLGPGYLSACLEALAARPDHAIVAGRAAYERAGTRVTRERVVQFGADSAAARVLRFFATVNVNGLLYGVMRREELAAVPFRPVVGGDWILVAAMLGRGKALTLREVEVHRSLGGLSEDEGSGLVHEFGLTGWRARHLHVVSALAVWRALRGGEPTFLRLSRPRREAVAALSAALVVARFEGYKAARGVLRRAGLIGAARRVVAPARRHRKR